MTGVKGLIAQTLTPHASAISLDPDYSGQGAALKDANCGLIMGYEKTSDDKNQSWLFS